MMLLKLAATFAVAMCVAVLIAPSAGAASSAGAPTASSADACLAAMKNAKTAPDGSAVTPAACTAAVAAANSDSVTITVPKASANVTGLCASYVPPTVTITPAHPVRGGHYTATGMNWPAGTTVFGYAIGYLSNGWLAGPIGVATVTVDSHGNWHFTMSIDSRPAAYYDLKFQDLSCPSATVSLRVYMTPSAQAPTTTQPASKAPAAGTGSSTPTSGAATLARSVTATSPGPAVLGAVATKSASATTTAKVTSSSSKVPGSLAFAGGSQQLLITIALALGAAGWLMLYGSRRGLLGRKAR
jgi:hypothetical protein